ncbi:MAG: class I SAM-dependent methyltransferase [Nitrospiraceae bacterium]|nr:class I SAM-dependent methyltransferase [Nitrospiraceae bacterium]
MRICEVCGAGDHERMHTQKFFIAGEVRPFHYDVSACRTCGFLFADEVPSQEEYERYYNLNSRYAYDRGDIPEGIKDLHRDIFRFVDGYLTRNRAQNSPASFRILDIGCSTGHLLHVLDENGYHNVLGIEPASECSSLAKDLYGIRVISSPLSGFVSSTPFDLVIMSGVLEHMRDLFGTLSLVSSLMAEGGALLTIVPDAERFSPEPREPFHEFSLEHINYFTPTSLTNLMRKFGIGRRQTESFKVDLYDSHALAAIWEKTNGGGSMRKDESGPTLLREYILASSRRMETLHSLIDALVLSQEEVVIWGAGSLTGRLFASTNLGKAKIRMIVDRNRGLHGKTLNGISIVSPEILEGSIHTVFISSYVYGDEIRRALERCHHRGRVILP